MSAQPKGDTGPSSLAFHGINTKMHGAMNIAYTGNADVDFVKGMISHHAGAVDMAKTVLVFGKDPEARKLAEEIIKAQESEIALMQGWLRERTVTLGNDLPAGRRELPRRFFSAQMIRAAERGQRIVGERGAVGLVGRGATPRKALNSSSIVALRDLVDDEHQPRAVVVVRPGRERRRRMEYVLHAVDHHRLLRRLGELHDALHAQQIRPVHRAHQIEEHLEGRVRDRLVGREREGADAVVVAVHVVMMVVMVVRIGFRRRASA